MDQRLKETIVIDDVIPKDLQESFHDAIVYSPHWRMLNDMSYTEGQINNPSYGFNCLLKHPEHGILSPLYESISVPIINSVLQKTKIQIKDIYYNRAFLQVPLSDKFYKGKNGIHVDIPDPHYACVYYLNDCDGDTFVYEQNFHDTKYGSKNVDLKVHKKVTPKKGRFVMFDGARFHCSSQPKDSYRCIINFVLI